MTTYSQPEFTPAQTASATQHLHTTGLAAGLLAFAGLLLARRRLRRLLRRSFRARSERRGMPLNLFLFLLVVGVPAVIAGILIAFGTPILTAILIGLGGLVLLVGGLIGALYFFGGEKES